MEVKKIKREELYELVWSKPITQIAAELGVSGSMVTRICKQLNVPRPELGYWAKLKAGKAPSTRKLPPAKSNTKLNYVIRQALFQSADSPVREIHPLILRESEADFKILVAKELLDPLSIVVKNQKSFLAGKLTDYNKVVPRTEVHFNLKISKKSVDRCMQIMDALLKAFKLRSWAFECKTEPDVRMTVSVLGEKIDFSIEEKNKRIDHIKTLQEEKQDYNWGPKYDFIPTGLLTLSLDSRYGFNGRSTFNDGKNNDIESYLNKFCCSLVEYALFKKDEREQQAREGARRLRQKIRNEGFKKARSSELARRALFESEFELWLRAQKIREFIEVKRKYFEENLQSTKDLDSLSAELNWASNYADLIDPLAKGVNTVLEDTKEEPKFGW